MIAALLMATNAQATEVVWTGIDYGEVRMVGTLDFHEPDQIFPGYLAKWNGLFMTEMLEELGKRLKADISASTSHLTDLHRDASAKKNIVRDDSISPDESFLSPEDVAKRVASYELTAQQGTGLSFIADQLNKPGEKGCYWVTFYDIESRKVLGTSRRCAEGRGFGFRNYWFGTAKGVVTDLRKKDVPGR